MLPRIILLGIALLAAGFGYKYTHDLPEKTEVPVPFTSQAPDSIWSEPWQNACEETSIVMINNFYEGDDLTKDEAREEILAVFNLKKEDSYDESMQTIADIVNSSELPWKAEVVEDPTLEDLKAELAAHRPILAPVYARKLTNPYYADGGPDYHVVVLTGYDDTTQEFLSHDPGTEQGEDFRYAYDEFMGAIHDFLSTDDYTAGEQRVLFTSQR